MRQRMHTCKGSQDIQRRRPLPHRPSAFAGAPRHPRPTHVRAMPSISIFRRRSSSCCAHTCGPVRSAPGSRTPRCTTACCTRTCSASASTILPLARTTSRCTPTALSRVMGASRRALMASRRPTRPMRPSMAWTRLDGARWRMSRRPPCHPGFVAAAPIGRDGARAMAVLQLRQHQHHHHRRRRRRQLQASVAATAAAVVATYLSASTTCQCDGKTQRSRSVP